MGGCRLPQPPRPPKKRHPLSKRPKNFPIVSCRFICRFCLFCSFHFLVYFPPVSRLTSFPFRCSKLNVVFRFCRTGLSPITPLIPYVNPFLIRVPRRKPQRTMPHPLKIWRNLFQSFSCSDIGETMGWFTVGQNSQEYRSENWATRSSIRLFACNAHSFDCSGLLARPPLRSLVRSLTLLTPSLVVQ